MKTKLEVFVAEVSALVGTEYTLNISEDEYGDIDEVSAVDSFGELYLTSHSEPEDACWRRDLQANFWDGVKLGVRNTVKVLVDNPNLIKWYVQDEN